jgi:hypothetical protein
MVEGAFCEAAEKPMFSVAGIFDGASDGIARRGKCFRVLKQRFMALGNNRVGHPPDFSQSAAYGNQP